MFRRSLPLILSLCFATWRTAMAADAGSIRFNRDIRPILSENCFYCHGQDPKHREAKLRLDDSAEATRDLGGYAAIVPGKPQDSEMIARLETHDSDDIMPPPKTHKHVSPERLALIKRWIAEGAKYEKHWSFVPPERAPLPEVQNTAWPRQDFDRFVLARLEHEGLSPSREAKPETWLRRASFDLTGLAPTPQELDAFLADQAAHGEAAYAAAVDRLLASSHFGERRAQDWLDAARYADSHGFNNDATRSMWRWRDWVIDAFNRSLPYDQFLTEQLAGDLLPKPSIEQRIATGFCRNHVINSEGGIIDEEYRVEYVVDRVRTLGMSILGLTLECSRCHDHKFDPLTQRDYYRFFAFFDQVPEAGEDGRVANAAPIMAAPTQEQQLKLQQIDTAIAAETAALAQKLKQSEPSQPAEDLQQAIASTLTDDLPAAPAGAVPALDDKAGNDPILGHTMPFDGSHGISLPKHPVELGKAWTFSTWIKWDGGEAPVFSTMNLKAPASATDYGKGVALRINSAGQLDFRMAAHWLGYSAQVISQERMETARWHHIAVTHDGSKKAAGFRLYLDGRECDTETVHDGIFGSMDGGTLRIADEEGLNPQRLRGDLASPLFFPRVLDAETVSKWIEPTLSRIFTSAGTQPASMVGFAREWLLRQHDSDFAKHFAESNNLRAERRALLRQAPTVMVMADLPTPRVTHILKRGQYDAPGEAVEPGVPEALLAPWPTGAPLNRLGLARWLTQPNHPLTARVAVNQFWQQLFGTGLVKTAEDFGSQGEYPIHPELLDWLARDFVDRGWNVKALLRTIVLSATYRQDSAVTPSLLERDPENRLLARGPRLRLPAETIRDHALAASGLLREHIGGPSVFPPQPATLYNGIVVDAPLPGTSWKESSGDDRYRRSLYTYWKRTVPFPLLTAFDAPDREFCTVRRARTNTPLQALALMNEPAMVEAAHHLGMRMLSEGGNDDASRLAFGFRVVTSRAIQPRESAVLLQTLEKLRSGFRADGEAAKALLKTAEPDTDGAAYAALAGLLLNLDETITKN